MSNFSEDYEGLFGIPGVTIEQTLLNEYDPYSGIDMNPNKISGSFSLSLAIAYKKRSFQK